MVKVIALVLLVLLGVLLVVSALPIRARRTRDEVARYIEDFLNGTGKAYDWDDFTSARIKDPELEAIRQRCLSVDRRFPPEQAGHYCNAEGLAEIRAILTRLRGAA